MCLEYKTKIKKQFYNKKQLHKKACRVEEPIIKNNENNIAIWENWSILKSEN